ASESTVVVADGEIVTPPIVPHAWAVLAMHPDGLPKLANKAEPGGVLLVNSSLGSASPVWPGVHRIAVPATDLAKKAGQPIGASMMALGALGAGTGLVGVGSLKDAVGDVLPPHRRKLADANQRCLDLGAEFVAGEATGVGPPAWSPARNPPVEG